MKQKCLGRTGLMVTENSFGALPIQRISDSEAAGLLRYAYDRGVNFFDTARAYSDSEHKIGLGLADVRENIILATKTMARTREAALADLETSLANLKTDHVDIWQLHCIPELPDPNDPDSAYQALVEARRPLLMRAPRPASPPTASTWPSPPRKAACTTPSSSPCAIWPRTRIWS